jgi:hypothetical protein
MSSLILAGDTSGAITLTVPTAAGTNTITLPASTGTAITTASTSGIPGTVNWTTVQTSSVSPAVAGTGYPMNTTSGALTVTLPAAPTAGQLISIVDYAGTAATNNITINPNGLKINGSTVSATISTAREAINLVYVDSTQGWLAYADVYSTTSPLPQPYTGSYLVLAGGGGGGGPGNAGGGGGAGGYVAGTTSLNPGTVYSVTVGAGGTGGVSTSGTDGTNSTFTGLTTAIGGGGGGSGNTVAGRSGGSGGGGGAQDTGTPAAGGAGTPGQGSAGITGIGPGVTDGGGGGGGAGGTGSASNGGPGVANSITGSSVIYGGGGGGGRDVRGGVPFGLGGPGTPGVSGGNGTGTGNPAVTAGVANTGGGGGGHSYNYPGNQGANGGSGVVILSVPTSNYPGTTTGAPTITTSGANTIIKWATTGSGSYTA